MYAEIMMGMFVGFFVWVALLLAVLVLMLPHMVYTRSILFHMHQNYPHAYNSRFKKAPSPGMLFFFPSRNYNQSRKEMRRFWRELTYSNEHAYDDELLRLIGIRRIFHILITVLGIIVLIPLVIVGALIFIVIFLMILG